MTLIPQPTERPRVWPLWFFYILAIFVTAFGSIVGLVFAPPPPDAGFLNPGSVPALLIGGEIALGSFAFVAAAASRDKLADRLRLRPPRLSWLRSASLLGATLGMAPLFGSLVVLTKTPVRGVMVELAHSLRSSSGATTVGIVIAGTIFPAIAEELFFRGFLQSRLTRRFGPLASVVATSAAFGVFHFDLHQGVYAFFLGLWLGGIAELSGSVLLPMAAHFVNNAVAMIPVSGSHSLRAGIALAGAIFMAPGWIFLVRAWRASPPAREAARPAAWSQRARVRLLFGYLVFSLTLFFVASALLGPTLAAMAEKGTTWLPSQ